MNLQPQYLYRQDWHWTRFSTFFVSICRKVSAAFQKICSNAHRLWLQPFVYLYSRIESFSCNVKEINAVRDNHFKTRIHLRTTFYVVGQRSVGLSLRWEFADSAIKHSWIFASSGLKQHGRFLKKRYINFTGHNGWKEVVLARHVRQEINEDKQQISSRGRWNSWHTRTFSICHH